MHRMFRAAVGVVAVLAPSAALAQGPGAEPRWSPSRTVTIVVPYTPGTGADTIARLLSPQLAERLGQPVVVDNKPGASGAIGTEFVATSPPDGHTLLFIATSHGTVPALKRNLRYDPVKSFTPVALAATSALALVVNPQLPASTFAEFVALAKKRPGELYYSSPGNGSPQHLAMELIKLETGMDLVHVPYKGSAGAARDLIGGHVQATVAALQTMAGYVTGGKLRMLAVLSEARSPAFPDVPTMRELGHPDLVVDTWYGVFAPAGTPPEAVARLNAELDALLGLPATAEAFAKQGLVPVVDKPGRMGALLDAELARWKRVVASAHIKAD